MDDRLTNWPLFIAQWELEELPAENVPRIALQALEAGCDTLAIGILAGLTSPTRPDVDEELPRLLREVGVARPSHQQTLKVVVDHLHRRIVDGDVEAYPGACALWSRKSDFTEDPVIWEQIRPFIGAASEWEDDPDHRARYERDIIAYARSLLAAGGVMISTESK